MAAASGIYGGARDKRVRSGNDGIRTRNNAAVSGDSAFIIGTTNDSSLCFGAVGRGESL
jgi:hypothetical protein